MRVIKALSEVVIALVIMLAIIAVWATNVDPNATSSAIDQSRDSVEKSKAAHAEQKSEAAQSRETVVRCIFMNCDDELFRAYPDEVNINNGDAIFYFVRITFRKPAIILNLTVNYGKCPGNQGSIIVDAGETVSIPFDTFKCPKIIEIEMQTAQRGKYRLVF